MGPGDCRGSDDRLDLDEHRGMSSAIGIILLVALTVIVAVTVAVFALGLASDVQPKAPYIETSHELVDDIDDSTDDKTIAITLEAGDTVDVDRLYVAGSKPIDIGGPPGTSRAAEESYASPLENFTETNTDTPQIAIGDTWDAGETVYVDPDGTVDGVTVSIYWVSRAVEGYNPGKPAGENSYRLTRIQVRKPA